MDRMSDHERDKPETGEPFLADYLQFLLATASGLASHSFHVQAAAAGVSVAEWRVLACLSDCDGQSVTELARLAQMEQSRLTRVIERMDNRGHVTRKRCRDDRRKVHVWLTGQGAGIARDLVARARAHETEFIESCLSPAEGRRLKALLVKLIERAGKGKVHAIRR
ncbi:MarR family winged helix-turn-helix transcriptional regulator [Paracoccus alkanivorans]|uniref:MarR family transcriptional regulator n=1 Tax=Paracoccus alkanivorans TaxID=2116655 RepID=A0A3M0M078_9RHOB|nr:MarR family winged helix-turn-helix transcriptional regulator [Paracoccus alkanivorans]RMC30815.1 MarR family transcriptional regulator [Paracoccus alkanivorans]